MWYNNGNDNKGSNMSDKKTDNEILNKISEDLHTIKNITVTYFVIGIIMVLIAILSAMASLGIK